MQQLHPKAVENASPDLTFRNTETPMLKSTENQQNANFLQKTSVLKSTQHPQNVNFSQESFRTQLKAEFLALKCFIKDELNDICETIEKVSQKFDQIFYREYTKNLWDEIASKNTIISLLTENINNLSRSRSQSENVTNHRNIIKHKIFKSCWMINRLLYPEKKQKKKNKVSPPMKI